MLGVYVSSNAPTSSPHRGARQIGPQFDMHSYTGIWLRSL